MSLRLYREERLLTLLDEERAKSDHLETRLVETEKFLIHIGQKGRLKMTVYKEIARFLDERGVVHDLWAKRSEHDWRLP